jgi:hypothetical protein
MEAFACAFAEGFPYDVALAVDADTEVVVCTDTDGASESASGDPDRKRVVAVVVAAVESSFQLWRPESLYRYWALGEGKWKAE